MHNASTLVVDEDALRANTAHFAALTGGRIMAVLKADAFGHGPVASSVVEAGASSLGVTSIAEAISLRAAVRVPILSWLNTPEADFAAALHADIDLAVPSPEILFAVSRAAVQTGRRSRVHLHIDVGMQRDGSPPAAWAALCELARRFELLGTIHVIGLMGHMSCADQPHHPQNRRERMVFEAAIRTATRRGLAPSVRHLAATAATLTGVGAGFDLQRIGAGLFGIDPSGTSRVLRPALSLTTHVVSVREAKAGTGVGYGLDHILDRHTRLALLPLGYADGLPWSASDRAEVLILGRRRPLVGRFSMDMVVADVGDDSVAPGEPVTIFGPGATGEPTVAEWAGWAGTIEHELITRLGARVARVHRSSGAHTSPAPEIAPTIDVNTIPEETHA